MASGEQTVEQKEEEQGEQEAKEIPQATPIAVLTALYMRVNNYVLCI